MRNPSGVTGATGRIFAALILAGFAVFMTTEASAQQLGGNSHPGADVLSINLHGGGFFSGSSFAGGARFEDTGAMGGTATFWAHRNVGLRANVLWYDHAIEPGTQEVALLGEDPSVFQYSGDLVLRMPMAAGPSMSWYPYILGGIGGKTYDFQTVGTETDLAGNFGAGLELRLGETGRFGIHTEVRDYISNFDRLEVDTTLHDVVWTGGISVNF